MQFLLLVNRIWTDVEVCHTHLVAVEADSTNNQTCLILRIEYWTENWVLNWELSIELRTEYWTENTKPLQLFCITVIAHLIDQRKMIFGPKISQSESNVLNTLKEICPMLYVQNVVCARTMVWCDNMCGILEFLSCSLWHVILIGFYDFYSACHSFSVYVYASYLSVYTWMFYAALVLQ